MNTYLGLDLGTSVLKATLIDNNGEIIGATAKEIHISSPKNGYAEESPPEWWSTFCELIRELGTHTALSRVKGVGLSGQMHGLVCYDNHLKPLHSAIIWADRRATDEVEEILEKVPSQDLYRITGNPIFTGFQLPTLLWLKKNSPDLFKKIHQISSPKDFITLQLTGNLKTEPSDALATGCFDYQKNQWSKDILQKVALEPKIFPKIIPTHSPYGKVTKETSAKTGLPQNIPVFGGSDQSMAAMGTGLIKEGQSLLAISTGGQFLTVTKKGAHDEKRRLHTLNHAIENRTIHMAATLSAGLSLKWFKTNIMQQIDTAYDTFIQGIDEIDVGSDGLTYLPFLSGERTPYFNPNIRGAFMGQTLNHNRLHLIRAIMEGVAYSFRDGLEAFNEANMKVEKIILSGGGTKNATWRQIITDVLNKPTEMINIEDHSPYGAAVYAKFAQEGFEKLPDFYEKAIVTSHKLEPSEKNVKKYDKLYGTYKKHAAYLNEFYRN